MSKLREAATEFARALNAEDEKAEKAAAVKLIPALADVLCTIAESLTKLANQPKLQPHGEGLVVGEIAKFEPAISPEHIERIARALEKQAGITR